MKGIVVSVHYDDLLSITLPRNARHLTDIVVVTSPDDRRTQDVARRCPSARCFATDAFTRNGGRFNKGAALEEGFDALGRDGWILIWDADTLLPDKLILPALDPAKLYGAKRRILEDASQWRPGTNWGPNWRNLPISREAGFPGYFQLFHGSCPRIATRPWYDVSFPHAGGGDGYFQSRWPDGFKEWLPFEVLHLGPRDVNWNGRVSPRLDGGDTNGGGMGGLLRGRDPEGYSLWTDVVNDRIPGVPTTGFKVGDEPLR